jgi:ATP-dependent RNA helicase DHX37/DHR1
MAKRVAEELNAPDHVAFQIRFEKTTTPDTRILFLTDGVLLKEVSSDLLLSRFSVVIVDEAHERNLNTDVLIGMLSRVVSLRKKMYDEWIQKRDATKRLGEPFEEQPRALPLKLIIMSATLRVTDFTENERLFAHPPPVLRIQARQYPVTVHFNRRTPENHIIDAFKKVSKIHKRLPPGGILVFLTGQNEIYDLSKRLNKKFNSKTEKSTLVTEEIDPQASVEDQMGNVDSGIINNTSQFNSELENLDSAGKRSILQSSEHGVESLDSATKVDAIQEDDEFYLSDDDADDDVGSHGSDAGDDDFDDDEGDANQPLHVLPLYSLLSTESQMRVFEPVPEGHRLCVVATNVAETSLTIPGIRYVVDCGKMKEKRYDMASSIQSFAVDWTSRSSADQRAGRAGRTGPGHCYRLYSSAVYENHFPMFSEPEILRMPIEGVVLQLKVMGIDQVVNFPFPTPPERSDLFRAEKLLKGLGALNEDSRATPTGTKMNLFPLHPRFSKMLLLGMQRNLLEYTISIVAALSVGELFSSSRDGLLPTPESAPIVEGIPGDSKEPDSSPVQKRKRDIIASFSGKDPLSDALFFLNLVGAYDYDGQSSRFCSKYNLREKAMNEINSLRQQLMVMVNAFNPSALQFLGAQKRCMDPPNAEQQSLLRQIILAGFIDHVALPHPNPPIIYGEGKSIGRYCFQTMLTGSTPCYIDRESVVTLKSGGTIKALVFSHLQQKAVNLSEDKERMVWMKICTVIDPEWIAEIAPPNLCEFGKPLEEPAPQYDRKSDRILSYFSPLFGVHQWELPLVKRTLPLGPSAYAWFARRLLEGEVLPGWASLQGHYATSPSALTKLAYQRQKKVMELKSALTLRKVHSRESLLNVWKSDSTFLLEPLIAWVKPESADALRKVWPLSGKSTMPFAQKDIFS